MTFVKMGMLARVIMGNVSKNVENMRIIIT